MIALLDVNLLVALAWPGHVSFATVHRWFARHGDAGWATCPITQAGFVRVLSNPAFSSRAVSPGEALAALAKSVTHPAHRFWADSISLQQALEPLAGNLVGHRQVTDAYLFGLALRNKGKLVTLDRAILSLALEPSLREHLEVL